MGHADDHTVDESKGGSSGEGARHLPPRRAPDLADSADIQETKEKESGRRGRPPKWASAARVADEITTLMLRGLPPKFGRQALAERLREEGFGDSFDFLYVPMNFEAACSHGFGFVNFVTAAAAREFMLRWQRRSIVDRGDVHYQTVAVAQVQGLAANVAKAKAVRMKRVLNCDFAPLIVGASGVGSGYNN